MSTQAAPTEANLTGLQEKAVRRSVLLLILLVTLGYLLAFSHRKAIWIDEALTFYTIHGRTLLGLLRFQSTTPIVLEPPANDILLWATGRLFGYSIAALRLPSMLLFLALQVMIYRLASLLGGFRAGLFAAALAGGALWVNYGAEARPYALLTALTAGALLLWHAAHTGSLDRRWVLVALALTVALATTSQFYGAMIVLPVLAGEFAWCILARRRPDLGLLATLGCGLLAIALDVPFLHAVRPYQPPRPLGTNVSWNQFLATYQWGFYLDIPWLKHFAIGENRWTILLLVIGIFGSLPGPRNTVAAADPLPLRRALWAALLALTLYPLPALALAFFVTHFYAPRYALQCIVGLTVFVAVVVARSSRRLPNALTALIALAALIYISSLGWRQLRYQADHSAEVRAGYGVSAPVRSFLARHSQSPLYLTVDECILYPFFGDRSFDPRLRCFASPALERRYDHSQLTSLTGYVLTHHTELPLAYADFNELHQQNPALMAYKSQILLSWIPKTLTAEHAQLTQIGPGFGGDVLSVTFPGPTAAAPTSPAPQP